MRMLTSDSLQFLYDLSQNNNRDWFEKNKARCEKTLKKPFEQTVSAIIDGLKTFEPELAQLEAKKCIFRLHRDVRFSNDKSPYKTHVSAFFAPRQGKTSDDIAYPGYYLQLSYGHLQIGGGAYNLDKPALHRMRSAIALDPATFHELVEAPGFVAKYGGIQGEKNKILPPEFKELVKIEPYLAFKQFYFMADLDPELAIGENFPKLALDYFGEAKPLNDYFRAVLYGGYSPV